MSDRIEVSGKDLSGSHFTASDMSASVFDDLDLSGAVFNNGRAVVNIEVGLVA